MSSDGTVPAGHGNCGGCSAVLPAALLACPSCGQLLHHVKLKQLAAEAEVAEQAHDTSSALAAWRAALALLPGGTRQHEHVAARVQALSSELAQAPQLAGSHAPAHTPTAGSSQLRNRLAGLGAAGALLLKFKWLVLAALSKAKLLLVGLGQAKTFLSMGVAIGAYTMAHGWPFAVGLVLSIYIHEMGHVSALRRYGISASAPMFIPGFGAFVRLNQHPSTPGEDARVGLAGPIWGAAAAALTWSLAVGLDNRLLHAIAHVGAYINLFNLLPIWQLDGGRAFNALSRTQRGIVAAALWVLGMTVGDGLLYVLAIAATARAAIPGNAPQRGDNAVLATYVTLSAGLTLLMLLAKG